MVKYIGMEIVFARLRQDIAGDAFQFVQVDKVALDQKNDVFEVCVKAAV